MFVRKCDLCEKEVKDPVVASAGFLSGAKLELCDDCGEPILKFLRKNKIIDKNNKEIKKA
ncbi:MAG: hypothetical protein A3G45_00985 [Candidatus Staskawiczbacteria bacterium RIFCSPLOWO2_12_FULL_37_15]|uniref:Uncharacterized protein n=1 Tax=Candidatus Staskawiczbacteria bacterium RIFCSPLOWO2_12_FULL_37_15 TaxID=1802218 RepID=A0A1G2ILP3_9BACT|nr:MAG: hypothetical protein US35_C0002G0003 [Parcubacteria group bacterium GW2011_GWA2_37_10]OGZ75330.1 MAG: hypothetical protein A3G45_00985 [Candidatus Staskawiczbacteria bacterium RIFCSPLOWO2_12_FULL_37_15]HLD38514.1 hypothetical protein [Candidatus Nanoarchaeia archaeon]